MAVKGFITKEIVKDPSKKHGCARCGLYEDCKNSKIGYQGQGQKKVLIVAEYPTDTEDQTGRIFAGESGDIVKEELRSQGYNLERDFWVTYAVKCRPPKGADGKLKDPTKVQIECCKERLQREIKELNPESIILMGSMAIQSLFYDYDVGTCSALHFRRLAIPDRKLKKWILPMYSPAWVLKNRDGRHIFSSDLKYALSCTGQPFPHFEDESKNVHCLTNYDDVITFLDKIIKEKPTTAFDYESSNLKPYAKGERILTVGTSFDGKEAFAFGLHHPEARWTKEQLDVITAKWVEVLLDPAIPKFAHNIRMEHSWGLRTLDAYTEGWAWDSMISAHILDERPEYTGLKFQVFVNWGLEGYEKEAHKYLEPTNRLHLCPLKTVLLYNGMDALFTYRLRRLQQKQFSRNTSHRDRYQNWRANSLFFAGQLALTDVSDMGVCADSYYFDEIDKELLKQIKSLEDELYATPEAKKFQLRYRRQIGLGSDADLGLLFYDLLGMKSNKKTASGKASVDAAALETLDHPFAKKILELRKLSKIQGTYLAQFKREVQDGMMHPNFNLHLVRTHRSSSSDPNFQNIPVRDEDAKALLRKGIIPHPGQRLWEVDYGAMEVRIIACYSKDPVLCKQIRDGFDMHKYWASIVYQKPESAITKDERQETKNKFVFPLFYGSYFRSVAKNMGLDENHIKKCEERFWREYKVTKKWQDDLCTDYAKKGYVTMLFGHKRKGFLSKNETINSPVQGAAFHCLLWALTQINKIRKAEGWKSKIMGQIHDSCVLSVEPSEEKHVIQTVHRIMTAGIQEAFPFIIVPLLAEFDAAPDARPLDPTVTVYGAADDAPKYSWYYKAGVKDLTPYGIAA